MGTFLEISDKLNTTLGPLGFEVHPFKVGWYNDTVQERFLLPYDYDAVAFLIISTPAMFEKAFKPYIRQHHCESTRDPVDQCMAHHFKLLTKTCEKYDPVCIHDFELHPNRRPKILMQTVGSVSGAARYYQRSDITNPPWTEKQKIFGVSVHPKYGGWFAFRSVIIFPGVLHPELEQKSPPDVVPDDATRIELLERFNGDWRSGTFRDIIDVEERYSEEQHYYFRTPPKDRFEMLEQFKS